MSSLPDAPESASVRLMDHSSLKYARWQTGFWAIMFGLGENSFALLASFLAAPPIFFGLMAGIPQLSGFFTQIISANLMEQYPHRKRLVLFGVMGQTVCLIPVAFLAFSAPSDRTDGYLLAVLALFYISGHFAVPVWTSMISDIVPSSRRGVIFSQFGRIASIVCFISMGLGGYTLYLGGTEAYSDKKAWFFFTLFIIASLARLTSFLLVSRMVEPQYVPNPKSAFTFWQFIRRFRESNFVKFVIFVGCMHTSANIAGPYFLPYVRYDLKMADWQWVIINSTATLATIGSLLFWGRFADKHGTKRTLIYSSMILGLQPIWWMLSDNFWVLCMVNLMSGISWGGFNLATGNYILEACSPHVRARCVAYYNIIIGCGVFMGSMIGAWMLRHLPKHMEMLGWKHDFNTTFMYVLLASAIARSLTALLFLPTFRELRTVHPFSIQDWFLEQIQAIGNVGVRLMPFGGEETGDETPATPNAPTAVLPAVKPAPEKEKSTQGK